MKLPSVIPATIINKSSCSWLEGTCSIEKLLRINLFLDTSSMAMGKKVAIPFLQHQYRNSRSSEKREWDSPN
jgi:hypothetical protein